MLRFRIEWDMQLSMLEQPRREGHESMTDQNRKTLRSFYCRDYLWELFEQMTGELGCSMDYLINESMRHYARSRDYAPGESGSGQQGFAQGSGQQQSPQQYGQQHQINQQNSFASPMDHRTFNKIPPVNQPNRPQAGGFNGQNRAGGPPPPPPRPASQQPGWGQSPNPGYGGAPSGQNFPQQPGQPQMGAGQAAQPPIYLLFNNNRYVIDKDKFVIGRGSQQTDLTIRDGNISRKHCAIIFRNGSYYIKDLGSTNGVEYRGNRIESKKIEESDTFYLCDYELRFTYRP